jgi:hypothetical protein
MISIEDWAEIRRLHQLEGPSKAAIARQLGIARNNGCTSPGRGPATELPAQTSRLD